MMLKKIDTASITRHLAPVVAKDTLLISDGEKAYAPSQPIALKGERVWRGYHIQNVNTYASGLKTWMDRFRGVATKYLDS
jgi:hypothetical protein